MPDRVSRDVPEDRPLAPLAWTRRRVLATGLVTAGVVAHPRVGAVRARPLPLQTGCGRGLDREITDLMASGKLPGVSAAVVRRDEVVWSRGYGHANLRREDAVRPSTLFMLASISKTVIATAVMQAVERRLFGLDDDVDACTCCSIELPSDVSEPPQAS